MKREKKRESEKESLQASLAPFLTFGHSFFFLLLTPTTNASRLLALLRAQRPKALCRRDRL